MSSHSGRVFLNSCLKVPIDPCNNCPAPIYNRPNMYLGRLTTTPSTTTMKATTASTKTSMKCSHIDTEATMWSRPGVRCLAQFYDSIPDYCEINHLAEDEFYSTLDTLRTTCRRLHTKPCNGIADETTPTPVSSSSSHSGKTHKSKSKKKLTRRKDSRCVDDIEKPFRKQFVKLDRINGFFKDDFQDEVDAFKRTLKELEDELRERPRSRAMHKSKSMVPLMRCRPDFDEINPFKAERTKSISQHVPGKSKTHTELRESLRRAFSLNDIPSLENSAPLTTNVEDGEALPNKGRTKFIEIDRKDINKMSNYFRPKVKTQNELKRETVVASSSPQTCSSSSVSTARVIGGRKKRTNTKMGNDQMKVPFSLFNLGNTTSKENQELKRASVSPVHPVARPNLAATLRAEVSRKKLRELQNNCTFDDRTPQIDWEVRKTPAWKSLNFNESHKQILSLRLATRKAEQALQRREYELHMELMRQRVKSAPLLLEGPTYWGPSVGKLTHTCPSEGQTHSCHSSQRRLRKKSARSRPSSEYGSTGVADGFCSLSHKGNGLRKIYSCSGSKSQCRSTGRGHGKGRKHDAIHRKSTQTSTTPEQHSGDDDDDLSSVDRAFL